MKTIQLSLFLSFVAGIVQSYGQSCEPPLAVCQDITISLDSMGEAVITPFMIDGGSTADCPPITLSIDRDSFTCDDLNPDPTPYGDFIREIGRGVLQNISTVKFGPDGHIYVAEIAQEVIQKWDINGNFLQTIGTQGFGVGQFANLRGIEIAGSRIYGTDDNRDKILVFDNLGNFLFEFGQAGTGPGQMNNPWRVTQLRNNIYVIDPTAQKVVVFDYNGGFLFEFGSNGLNPGQFQVPYSLDTNSLDQLLVYDQHRRKVLLFDHLGNFNSEFGEVPSGSDFIGEFDIVNGIAVGPDNRIYAADRSSTSLNNKIKVFEPNGNHVYEFGFNGNGQGKFRSLISVDVRYDNLVAVSDIQRDVIMLFEQKTGGNLVTLSITDSLGTEACCIAEVTLIDNSHCANPDLDGDGFSVADGDCDDNDPNVNPGAAEICNSIDDNCNGLVDNQDSLLVDNDPPYFIGGLPGDFAASCDFIPEPDTVDYVDQCGGVELAFTQTSNYDGSCNNYQIYRTWNIADDAGNDTSHTQIITVEDNIAPSFTSSLPSDTVVDAQSVPMAAMLEASDNCHSGQPIYMEMDPIDPSNESLILTGTLGSTAVTWALEGVTTDQYKFRDVFTDNSLTTFSNSSYYTPASSGLDGAGFNAISGMATLRISFASPVINPILHLNNIDISRWDFRNTTYNISLLSGNDHIQLVNGILSDPTPETSGGPLSGQGSVLFHGSFTEIVAELSLVDVTTDGLFLQLSATDGVQIELMETSIAGECPGDQIVTRVWTAMDGCGNTIQHQQTITVSGYDPGPAVTSISIPVDPLPLGTDLFVSGTFTDTCDLDDHQVVWDWGDGSTSIGYVDQSLNEVFGDHLYDSTGVYQVTMTILDNDGNTSSLTSNVYVVIYDAGAGFVTGGGWIYSPAGAYLADSTVAGKANFGFVSKYKKGASIPDGNTQFQFKAANFKFKSTVYDWLVIAGDKAKFKGEGKINNQGHYGFMLTGIDGDLKGQPSPDQFRIKIWDISQGDQVVYDNQLGSDELAYEAQDLQGGSITIHQNSNQNFRKSVSTRTSSSEDFNIFPNPANGRVLQIIHNGDHLDNSEILIYNMQGQVIYHQKASNKKQVILFDERLSNGVYIVAITSQNQVLTKKWLVTK